MMTILMLLWWNAESPIVITPEPRTRVSMPAQKKA